MKFDADESAEAPKPVSGKPLRKSRVNAKSKAGKLAARTTIRNEWVELLPHGISVASSIGRPVLILKDSTGVEVLPVWMQPLDAGVAMAELSHSTGATPHAVTRRLLEMMKVTVESCSFVDLVGHHQFVKLDLKTSDPVTGKTTTSSMRVRADEAMSFCLQARARFYCTRDLMARCRDLDGDLAKLEHNLNDGALPALQAEMENSSKKHPYVM